ncbi:putative bifunctional diguanylate cyclase/phosphodiesterase [Xanthobacter variabilis]|uniref:putative bifunctional diguanylate cyclase/phosphodiesterase n=1 Tax=Xanthobacter variabilis TaxID=3119932 RepID=UPI00374E55B5
MVTLFLLFLASAMALGYAISRHDRVVATRESEAVKTSLREREIRIRDALSGVMTERDLLAHIARGDLDDLHQKFGRHLQEAAGLEYVYIVDAHGKTIYASENGRQGVGAAHHALEPAITRLLTELHEAPKGEDPAGLSVGDGEAVVLTATVFRLQSEAVASPQPLAIIGADVLDSELLSSLARSAALEGGALTLSDRPANLGKSELVEPNLLDGSSVRLTWRSDQPAAFLLLAAVPLLLVVAVALCLVFFVLMLRARRLAAALGESEARAREIINQDQLTGLCSRGHFVTLLDAALKPPRRTDQLAVVFVDLDDFKAINDSHGHAVGDQLLQVVARRLRGGLGERGAVARVGGDEFVLFAHYETEAEFGSLVASLYGLLSIPVLLDSLDLRIATSMGAARAPKDANDSAELMRLADIALYRAKADGGGIFRDFEVAFEQEQIRLRRTEQEVVRALEHGELTVLYQPQVDVETERVVGFEALVRWDHPTRGRLLPGAFVPIAERSRLITRIDAFVLRRACTDARRLPGVTLSVNLSPLNLRTAGIADDIQATLRETGFDPNRLELEITESAIIDPGAGAALALTRLRERGIRLALDDFGTGHASLVHVRRYPITKIKVDRSFIMNLGQQRDAASIVEYVVRLGRSLGVTVTAEGVETREQLRFLRAFGAHHAQGYLFGPPLSLEAAVKMVERQRTGAVAATDDDVAELGDFPQQLPPPLNAVD